MVNYSIHTGEKCEEIRDAIQRMVRDLPQEALTEAYHAVKDIQEFYDKSKPPKPSP